MSTIPKPPLGCVNSSEMDLFQMASLMSATSNLSPPEILPVTPNIISLPELVAGLKPSVLPDGLNPNPSGPPHVPVKVSPFPENKKAKKTRAISGPFSSGSSASMALSGFLVNRLKTQLATAGSMEYKQTWREKVTPLGIVYWAHTARAHPTSDNGSTGWPTPRSNDGTGAQECKGRTGGASLAGWATPNAPRKNDSDHSAFRWNPNKKQDDPVLQILGRTAILSSVPMEKRGALNPAFSLWLMGYRAEWASCGVRAMQSLPKPRRTSSAPA